MTKQKSKYHLIVFLFPLLQQFLVMMKLEIDLKILKLISRMQGHQVLCYVFRVKYVVHLRLKCEPMINTSIGWLHSLLIQLVSFCLSIYKYENHVPFEHINDFPISNLPLWIIHLVFVVAQMTSFRLCSIECDRSISSFAICLPFT